MPANKAFSNSVMKKGENYLYKLNNNNNKSLKDKLEPKLKKKKRKKKRERKWKISPCDLLNLQLAASNIKINSKIPKVCQKYIYSLHSNFVY
jgi:hypothetical protein